jgi:hypothetical protein
MNGRLSEKQLFGCPACARLEVEESLRRVIEAEAKARSLREKRATLYKEAMSAMDRTLGAAEAQARAANAAHRAGLAPRCIRKR